MIKNSKKLILFEYTSKRIKQDPLDYVLHYTWRNIQKIR